MTHPLRWSQPAFRQSRSFTNFFLGRPSLSKLTNQLARAIQDKDANGVRAPYLEITKHLRQNPETKTPLNDNQLLDILSILSTSKSPANHDLLKTAFDDIQDVFKTPITSAHQNFVLKGMCHAGTAQDAFDYLVNYIQNPTTFNCNLVLKTFVQKSPQDINIILDYMKQNNVLDKSIDTFKLLLDYHFNYTRDISKVQEIVNQVSTSGKGIFRDVEQEQEYLVHLLQGYVKLEHYELAKSIANEIEQGLLESDAMLGDNVAPYNALIRFTAQQGGFDNALEEMKKWKTILDQKDASIVFPNEDTLAILAQIDIAKPISLDNAIELTHYLEQEADLPSAGPRVYQVMMSRLLHRLKNYQPIGVDESPINDARSLYNHAVTSGVIPDCEMMLPLMKVLAQPLRSPTLSNDNNLDINNDNNIKMVNNFKPTPEQLNRHTVATRIYKNLDSFSYENEASTISLEMFDLYLKSCANARDVSEVSDIAKRMNQLGLRFGRHQARAHIINLIQASNDFQEAFNVYTWLQSLHSKTLQHKCYNAILAAMTKLRFTYKEDRYGSANSGKMLPLLPPPTMFVQVIKDMRAAGYPPDNVTYTTVLYYYSKLGLEDSTAVRTLHNTIKLDQNFDPDRSVMNALVAAYGRARDYDSAMNVWKILLANPNLGIDNVSVSVILDLCSFAGFYTTAQNIWKARLREGFPLTKKNWDTYVECLARLGKMDHALDIIVNQMNGHVENIPKADSSTCTIVLKFAQPGGTYDHVRKRLRQTQPPQVWEQIKSVRQDEATDE